MSKKQKRGEQDTKFSIDETEKDGAMIFIGVKVKPETHKMLEALKQKSGQSVSAIVRKAIDYAFENMPVVAEIREEAERNYYKSGPKKR